MKIPKRLVRSLLPAFACLSLALSAFGQDPPPAGSAPAPEADAPAKPEPAEPAKPADPKPPKPEDPKPPSDPVKPPTPPADPPKPPVDPPKPPAPDPVEPPNPPKVDPPIIGDPPGPPTDPPIPVKPPAPPVDPPKPPADPPTPPTDPEDPDPKDPEAEEEKEEPKVVTKERRIYIPFDELEKAFADEGRGVFLPYREFLDLWNELTLERKKKEEAKPPTDAILSSATYTAKLDGEDTLAIEAEFALESFKDDGWAVLKLGSPGMNIAEAETGDAILRLADDGSYEILIPKKGTLTAKLKIFAKVSHGGGRHTAHLHLPKSAVSRFTGEIPGREWEFEIQPGAPFTTRDAGADATELSFFFGGGQPVQVTWQKKGGETKLTPLLFAETDIISTVQAGALTTEVAVNYRVLRAGVDAFKVSVPQPHEVLGVSGENIREWDIAKEGEKQVLTVNLHVPAKDHYSLGITLEAPIENLPAKLSAPAPEALDALRQRGSVTLRAAEDLEVVLEKIDGLTQQGAGAAPNAPAAGSGAVQMLGRYRFLRFPFSADLSVTRAEPVVEVNSFTRVTVEPDLASYSARMEYNVKRVGIFGTRIGIPEGYDNVEAVGDIVEDFNEIDLPDGGGKVLDVKFTGRCINRFTFSITGQKPRKSEDADLAVPIFDPKDVARHEGKVGLDIHTSLEPNTKAPGALRQQDVSLIAKAIGGKPKSALTPLTLGFHYRGHPETATLAFKLKQPQVTADVHALVDVREQLVRYRWRYNFSVLYAGIDSFVLAVPSAYSDDLRLEDQSVKEIQKDFKPEPAAAEGDPAAAEPPAALPEGTTLWKIVLRDKKLGKFDLDLSLEVPLEGLEAGKGSDVTMPQLALRDVFQETGQVAVIKDGSLEILKPKTKNLEGIDPKELRGDLRREGVFLAYKYKRQPIALTLTVSKNEFLSVPQALVTDAVLKSVVASDGGITTEVVYWVNNNAMQFLSLKLPKRGSVDGKIMSDVYVAGSPQQPMKRPGSDEIAIRLPSGQANRKFTVRFVYQIPSADAGSDMGWSGSFSVPPPELLKTDILRTSLSLYLPDENVYTGFEGPMKRPVTARGWNRFRRAFDWIVPALGPDPNRATIAGWTNPPQLPSSVADGFDVPVKGEGHLVKLYRLAGPGTVEVSYRSRGFSFFIEALFCLVAFAAGLALSKSTVGAKAAYFVVAGLGSLLIAGAVNPGGARVWSAVFIGVVFAVFAWIVIGIFRKTRDAMKEVEAKAKATPPKPTDPDKPTDGGGTPGGGDGGGGDDKGDGGGSSDGGDTAKSDQKPDPEPKAEPEPKPVSKPKSDPEPDQKSDPAEPSAQQIIIDPFRTSPSPEKPKDKPVPKADSDEKSDPPPAFPEVTPKKEDK